MANVKYRPKADVKYILRICVSYCASHGTFAIGERGNAALGLDLSLPRTGLIPATSIIATVSKTDRSFQLTSEPMRFPPLEVIGSSPRSPLKTVHWTVFRALRTFARDDNLGALLCDSHDCRYNLNPWEILHCVQNDTQEWLDWFVGTPGRLESMNNYSAAAGEIPRIRSNVTEGQT